MSEDPGTRMVAPRAMPAAVVGGLARSLAGHDRGRLYAIQAIEAASHGTGQYLLLIDGVVRGWERPKRKNLKHMRVLEARLDEAQWAAIAAQSDRRQADAWLAAALRDMESKLAS